MNYVQAHAIVELMLNVMFKIIIQFVYANRVILEIHNSVAINWNVNQMMNALMTKHVSIMNVLVHVCYQIHVR